MGCMHVCVVITSKLGTSLAVFDSGANFDLLFADLNSTTTTTDICTCHDDFNASLSVCVCLCLFVCVFVCCLSSQKLSHLIHAAIVYEPILSFCCVN